MDDMGIFRTIIGIESLARRGPVVQLPDTLVDTGSEYSWVPAAVLDGLGIARERVQRFVIADGRILERPIGFAVVHAGGTTTADDVVFAEPDDLILLGARSLEGLNLRVDPARKELVPAGPILAAAGGRVWPPAYWERLDGLPPLSDDFAAP
jgi:predicted aspartyl protease